MLRLRRGQKCFEAVIKETLQSGSEKTQKGVSTMSLLLSCFIACRRPYARRELTIKVIPFAESAILAERSFSASSEGLRG